ncbi:MAG: formyltransferase family protein, partial [Methanosarcina vacuolata]|nr:formyltransferase family protein [Methanosarcina vacuolata]
FRSRPLNLKNFSKKLKIPYYYLRKGDNETFQKWMKHLQPDIIVVYSMSHLLKENIFTIPKLGTINLHYSHLPEYRGPSPLFWEYYDYILNPGVTLHYINKGEDTGDIIFQERILISSGDKLEEVVKKLSLTGIKFLLKTMDIIESGDVPRIKQSATTPTVRARKIKPGEYSELIKWDDWGVERVFHFLSGTPKYHYTLMKKPNLHKLGFTIKILNKEKCNTSGYKVGDLCKENSKHFLVCKNGKIYVDVTFSPASFLARIYPYIC